MRPIALLSDFGLADPYVGQLKAALVRMAPLARLLDISHQVEPFNAAQAAFFLAASAPHFPADAVFVAVVDPGVGTGRRVLGAQVGGQSFITPDAGLLGLLLRNPGLPQPRFHDLTAEAAKYSSSSSTFHGRDILAPLAAGLASGTLLEELGPELPGGDIVTLPWAAPQAEADGLRAHVLHVDRFGNCVLSLRGGDEIPGEVTGLLLGPGERRRLRLVRTYAELAPGEAGMLVGSQGFYELAANMGSAARLLTLRGGDGVHILLDGRG